jgi:polysaccharide biosynthesis protein PelA
MMVRNDVYKNQKLNNINNFTVYYGHGKIDTLKNFDLVILEPSAQDRDSIMRLKAAGIIVLAYVSVMEISKTNKNYSVLREEDFLKVQGERVLNKEFDTELIDLRSKRWRAVLGHHIGNLFLNLGYDGVFLDTLGDIEFGNIVGELKHQLIDAALKFLQEIRERFKECIIIQNNGVNDLYAITGNLIDGICWENPPFNNKKFNKYLESVTSLLSYLQREKNIKVLLLIEEHKRRELEEYAERISREQDFLLYFAPKNYLNL